MSAEPAAPQRMHHASSFVAIFTGLVIIGCLVFGISHFGNIEVFGQMLRQARPQWLVAALLLQGSTYVSVALGWRAVLAKSGAAMPLRRLVPLAISKLFADQMIPVAGMGGNVLLVDRLISLGTPRGAAVATLIVSIIGFYAVYGTLALVTLLILTAGDKATVAVCVFFAIFMIVAMAIPGFALWLRKRGSRPLSPMFDRFRYVLNLPHVVGEAPKALVFDHGLILTVAAFNGVVFLADSATLMACFLALGHGVGLPIAFVAVMVASMVTTLGPVPLGLGSFEAGSTAALSLLGVPLELALAGTLLLRAFTLWLPLLVGLILMPAVMRRRSIDRA